MLLPGAIAGEDCAARVVDTSAGGDCAARVVDTSVGGDGVVSSMMFSCKGQTVAFLLLPRVGATS